MWPSILKNEWFHLYVFINLTWDVVTYTKVNTTLFAYLRVNSKTSYYWSNNSKNYLIFQYILHGHESIADSFLLYFWVHASSIILVGEFNSCWSFISFLFGTISYFYFYYHTWHDQIYRLFIFRIQNV